MLPNKINKIKIIFTDNFGWSKVINKSYFYYYTGSKSFAQKFIDEYLVKNKNHHERIKFLKDHNTNTSLIVKKKDLIFCFTSFSRDYPIFYKNENDTFLISNNIYNINKKSDPLNQEGIREFLFSGFVLNDKTLNKNIFALEPSQILFVNKKMISKKNYFKYHQSTPKKKSFDQLFTEFNSIIDKSIDNILEKSNEGKIFIPLSGGLDSRFLLAKFCEKKYKNIECFSYGLKNNSDALIAKQVANHLNVKWKFVWFEKKKYRKFFVSKFKSDYDKFSDHLSTLPNYQEIFFLKDLYEQKYFNNRACIINGQSADFHTGLHIPENLFLLDMKKNYNSKILVQTIINNHLSLWPNDLKTNDFNNLFNQISDSLDEFKEGYNLSDIYEYWEFKERQCKYIVNGQRAYDFINIKWFLPFWDSEFIKFWSSIPLEQRFKQTLYRKILLKWDYNSLFSKISKKVQAFEGIEDILIKTISRLTKILLGKSNSKEILKYFDYYSRYGNSYQLFSMKKYLFNRHKIRNAYSLHTKAWLAERKMVNEEAF